MNYLDDYYKKLTDFIYSNKQDRGDKYSLICDNIMPYQELCSISPYFLLDPSNEILKCHNFYYTHKYHETHNNDFGLIFNQLSLKDKSLSLEYPLNIKISAHELKSLLLNSENLNRKFLFISPSFFKYIDPKNINDLNNFVTIFNEKNCLFVFNIKLKHLHLCSFNLFPILYILNNSKNKKLSILMLENYILEALLVLPTTKFYMYYNDETKHYEVDMSKSKGNYEKSTINLVSGILDDFDTFSYLINVSDNIRTTVFNFLENHILNKEEFIKYINKIKEHSYLSSI